MASQKDKYLESAQRFVLRGQIDRAIRDYQQVVALDPRDNRYRQKLAELLVRDGRKDEAIEQFEDIARNYAQNSYYLKAIAVYKQIQRLVPNDTHISLTLAELNHKQGLVGNALAEYGQVVGALEREGNLKKVMEVLEQMISIDGQNLTTRLRYAETQRRIGENEAAYTTFSDILRTLRTRGDLAGAEKFEQRLNLMYPEKAKLTAAAAPAQRQRNEAARAAETEIPHPAPHAELPISLDEDAAEPEPAASTAAAVALPGGAEGPELGLSLEAEELPSEPAGATESLPDFDLPDFLQEELPSAFAAAAEPPSAVPDATSTDASVVEEEGPATDIDGGTSETAAASEPYWEVDIELDFDDDVEEVDEASTSFAASEDGGAAAVAGLPAMSAPEPSPLPPVAEPAEAPIEEGLDWLDLVDLEAEGSVAAAPSAATVVSANAGAPVLEPAPVAELPAPVTWGDIFPEWDIPAADSDLAELQSHYDLGLAYREMGMYRDAIKELFQAGRNPRRRVDSLTFQALCYRDLGDNEKAQELLTKGRSLQGVSVEERMWLGFELAELLEQTGRPDAALQLYQEVYAWNAGFQDVALRLGRLTGEEKIEEIELEEEFSP